MVILTLLVSDTVINSLVRSTKQGEFGKINAVMHHYIDEPMMIWGASTALVHFNPMIIEQTTGLASFNMGLDGTSIDQYFGLLEEFILYSKDCRYLIIAVDIGGLTDRTAIYNLHLWATYIRNDRIANCLRDIDNSLVLNSSYFPFYSLTLHNRTTFSSVKSQYFGSTTDVLTRNKGFLPRNLPQIDLKKPRTNPRYKVELGSRSIFKLRKACELARNNKMQPIVVITPCYVNGLAIFNNLESFVDTIESLTDSGTFVLNYLKHSGIYEDSSLFYNNTHLNSTGANKFSRIFSEDFLTLIQENNNASEQLKPTKMRISR